MFYEEKKIFGEVPTTWLPGNDYGTTTSASKELKNIFGKKIFDYPKPVELIKYLLHLATKDGDIVLDSFAGSGSIGLEAISRGAKRAYFIELDRNSYQILLKNCKSIDMEKCQTVQGNTFVQTPLFIDFLKNSQDEIVLYVDPPFDYRDGMEDIYEKSFAMIRDIEVDNIYMIIIEHVSALEMPEVLGRFSLNKTKKFGKSALSYYSYTEE
mgnify:CR=1 FL=1